MKKKIVKVGYAATKEVFAGVYYAADIVGRTLGIYGKNVASGIVGGPVSISNDGISLLDQIEGRTEIEDLGVRAVREAARKTNDKVGDATTTAAVLTASVLKVLDPGDMDKVIGGAGKVATVQRIEKLRAEKKEVVEMLRAMAEPISEKEDLVNAARVSGEYKELSELIGEAWVTVGPSGTVIAEEALGSEDSVEYVHGIKLDNGYSSSKIINRPDRGSLELENAFVILTNKVFHGAAFVDSLNHIFSQMTSDTNVVLMGRGFDDEAIGTCMKNIQFSAAGKGGLKIFPLNAPYVDQDEIMEDLAAVLGAKYINGNERNLESIQKGDMGRASKVIARRFEGIISGVKPGTDPMIDNRVKARVERIEEQLKGDLSEFERKHLEARLSQLRAGTAVIKVTAATDSERKHKKDKVDDAINSVKHAYRDGVVRGGGLALEAVSQKLPDDYLLKQALRKPHELIMSMAPDGFVIEPWVREAVTVVITALENAVDVACMLSTTDIAVNWEREKPQYVTSVDNKIRETNDE